MKHYIMMVITVVVWGSIALAADAPIVNPTADELCAIYARATGMSQDKFASEILRSCKEYSAEYLTNKDNQPVNLRHISLAPNRCAVNTCAIVRSGQPEDEKAVKGLKSAGVQYVIDLRYDRFYDFKIGKNIDTVNKKTLEEVYHTTFGSAPYVPLAPWEEEYSFLDEKKRDDAQGLVGLYFPTIPETEHMVGNYSWRFDVGSDPMPYICRLPLNIAIDEKKHWLEDHAKFKPDQALLLGRDPECKDLYPRYGEQKVRAWVHDVRTLADESMEEFVRIARVVMHIAQYGGKVDFHCAGGADRAGRVAAFIELEKLGVSRKELAAYRGPLSDPKLDLIAINYLLSQRRGSKLEYRNFFPNRDGRFDMERSPLYHALKGGADKTSPKKGLRASNSEIVIPVIDKTPN